MVYSSESWLTVSSALYISNSSMIVRSWGLGPTWILWYYDGSIEWLSSTLLTKVMLMLGWRKISSHQCINSQISFPMSWRLRLISEIGRYELASLVFLFPRNEKESYTTYSPDALDLKGLHRTEWKLVGEERHGFSPMLLRITGTLPVLVAFINA